MRQRKRKRKDNAEAQRTRRNAERFRTWKVFYELGVVPVK
jgi:hypothetical protein